MVGNLIWLRNGLPHRLNSIDLLQHYGHAIMRYLFVYLFIIILFIRNLKTMSCTLYGCGQCGCMLPTPAGKELQHTSNHP